jgi:hypothetical protein
MSRSAFSSTIEMALAGRIVARFVLEQGELLIGSDYGVILLPLQMALRSFEPILPAIEVNASLGQDHAIVQQLLGALEAHQSIEIFGHSKAESSFLLRSLAHQFQMEHGALYVNQADGLEDVLQWMFEQLYQVPADVKASRAEIRAGLHDRQVLILLNHPTLTKAELEKIDQILPESLFVVSSSERRFFQAGCEIDVSDVDGLLFQPQTLEDSEPDAIFEEKSLLMATLQTYVRQKQWADVLKVVRSTEQRFTIAKFWGAWEQLLQLGLQAAWALEDEGAEAWALHQLGTLAFCQEQVTLGYDLLKQSLDLRTDLGEKTAIAFSQHNLSQLKALIVPVKTKNLPQNNQRYWF